MDKPIGRGIVIRTVKLNRAGLNREARTVPITVSSDAPIPGRDGVAEILPHTPEAVDLERANAHGLPLIIVHRQGLLPVGRVNELTLEGGAMQGLAKLTRSSEGDALLDDIDDGILTDVSVGAVIEAWDDPKANPRRATRWAPLEASLTAMGADPRAKIHRSLIPEGDDVDPKTKAAAEKRIERTTAINALFEGLKGDDFHVMHVQALSSEDDVDVVRNQVLAKLKGSSSSVRRDHLTRDEEIRVTRDAIDGYKKGVGQVLALRANLVKKDERTKVEQDCRESTYYGMTLMDLAREYCRVANIETKGLNRDQVAYAAITRASGIISHGPSDFTNLLADTANKSLAIGYNEAPETWQVWTGRDQAPDFKQADRPVLSTFGDLDEIVNDEEYKYGTFSDKKEVFTLKTYGKLFSIGRRAIINDDLNAFTRIPQAMGRAAARKVGDLVYAVLTDNAAMNEDAKALFHTDHGNLAGSGAAISITTLGAGRTAMQTATDPAGNTINVRPAYLLVRPTDEDLANQIVAGTIFPTGSTSVVPAWARQLTVVSEPRLGASSLDDWYLAASPMAIDTVLVAFLNGVETPFLDREEGFTRDGVSYKVRHDADAYAGDYRGLYKNPGS